MNKGLMLFPILAILFLMGCDGKQGENTQKVAPDAWLSLRVGDVPITAQLAISNAEKTKGLMYRESLPENGGMLFLYDRQQQVSFWMANTPLPLDLGLFDSNGVLKEIHRLMPYDTTTVSSNSREIRFGLEMEQGWFARNKLYPGVKLDLITLTDAVRSRGGNPALFGLTH